MGMCAAGAQRGRCKPLRAQSCARVRARARVRACTRHSQPGTLLPDVWQMHVPLYMQCVRNVPAQWRRRRAAEGARDPRWGADGVDVSARWVDSSISGMCALAVTRLPRHARTHLRREEVVLALGGRQRLLGAEGCARHIHHAAQLQARQGHGTGTFGTVLQAAG